jgi:hypothetical protein
MTGRIPVCGECGIPLLVSGELNWEDNGVISSKTSPRNRWVFYESEVIDPLFRGIEQLIGMPIEHIIIESRRRESRRYLERTFPVEMRQKLFGRLDSSGNPMPLTPEERETRYTVGRDVYTGMHDVGRVFGYGSLSIGHLWETGDDNPWRSTIVGHPYSIPFVLAEILAGCEAFEGRDLQVEHHLVGEGVYQVDALAGDHPLELQEKLKRRSYEFKPGQLSYERCPECGIPHEITRYRWNLDNGTIFDPDTGRRMAIFGPSSLDSVFEDLASELGGAVPEVIIEAQRLHIKDAWSADEWKRGATDFQHLLALRGLGNLTGFDGDRGHLTILLNNSCLPLLMAGMVQALVEMAYRAESSTCTWELHDDGDLSITVAL